MKLPHQSVRRCVLFRNRDVMVDQFGLVRLQLNGVPHHGVQIGEVVVHVVAFVAEATQSPAG